jgi:hypothetical protein
MSINRIDVEKSVVESLLASRKMSLDTISDQVTVDNGKVFVIIQRILGTIKNTQGLFSRIRATPPHFNRVGTPSHFYGFRAASHFDGFKTLSHFNRVGSPSHFSGV